MYKYILEGYCHESDPIKKINGSGSGNPLIILIYIFKILLFIIPVYFIYICEYFRGILVPDPTQLKRGAGSGNPRG